MSVKPVKYHLRIWAIGRGEGIELAENEYDEIVSAIQRRQLATEAEERLDLLLENYAEYETELLDLALRHSLFTLPAVSSVQTEIHLLARRTLNLLAAARFYTDQVKHVVSQYFEADDEKRKTVSYLFSAQYDEHREYRIAEALRNYSQHRALPIQGVQWQRRWEEMEDEENRRLRSWVVPYLSVAEIDDEGDFKAQVLDEMKALEKELLPLTPILRRYVESLVTIHEEIRELLEEGVAHDEGVIEKTLERAEALEEKDLVGLVVSATEDSGTVAEKHPVTRHASVRRAELLRKNGSLANLARRYASGEHSGDSA